MSESERQRDRQQEWNDKRASWAEELEAQTAALDRLGFGPAYSTGGGTFAMPVYFATCRTCGAACQIIGGVTDEEQPTYLHHAWHS